MLLNIIAGEMSSFKMKMKMPEHVLMNDDIHGQCVSGERWPHIVIKANAIGCNFKIHRQRRVIGEGANKIFCTDFVIRNVTATCQYMCAFADSRVTKKVVVTGMHIMYVCT